jgi:uncharacterized protein (DUF58 family)
MKVHVNRIRLIIYFIMLTGSIVFASFYGGLLPFVILYGMIVFIPVSLLYIALNYHFLSIFQELPKHRVVKGETNTFRILIENRGLLTIHEVILDIYNDRCNLKAFGEGITITLKAHEKRELVTDAVCIYAGTYEIGVKSLGFTDAFGIFTVTLPVPYSFRAVVSPRVTGLADRYVDIENILNSAFRKSDRRYEELAGSDMRMYSAGDPMSAVNWKVSARLDKLMVRIPDKMDTRTVTLVLNAEGVFAGPEDIGHLKRRDYFLEFAVSAAWYFGERGMPLRIYYPLGKITEMLVDSYDSFLEFYTNIAGGISYRSEDERDRMRRFATERRVTPGGSETTVIVNEEAWPSDDFCTVAG